MKKTILVLTLFGLLLAANSTPAADQKISVPLTFDHYYSYEEMVEAIKALNKAFPTLTKVDLVGKSEEDRAIYCVTVNNPETGAELDKPGVYIDGNIHGNEIQATEVCLYLLNYILTKYGENENITEVVDKNCFYVIPSVNVDGRYHFFNDPNTASSNRGLRRPKDDDRDGLVNEDFPDDLDGDGNICMMRKKDPYGQYKTDPEDPRLMIRIKPGEKGEWTLLGQEGIDNDGDGLINEDSEGYVDPNRNWGFDWMPEYVQSGAGDYPFSGKGIKAMASFIRQRPNICMAWAFHNSGGLYLRGPSQKNLRYPLQDIQVYDYLGKQGERITPGYQYLVSWKDLYTTYGDFIEWMVGCNGAYGFVGELFQSSTETFKTRQEEKQAQPEAGEGFPFMESNELARERLKFNDHLAQGELYKPWAPCNHPTYGEIEIGGWVKYSSRMPAPFMLKDLVHRNAMAVLFSAKNTPEVSMDVFEVKEVENNLYRLRVRLKNSKAIPTMSYYAQQHNLFPKDQLTVSGKNAQVLAGGKLLDPYRNTASYKEHRPELQFLFVPGFGNVEYQFLVSGKGNIQIKYESRFGGKITQTIELK
ncbi:MAG TPA: M14 family metallopeptidase [Acidobacteriota bacterium]|nr:M14 family metallopeptidase [Acidobacteriota bacterium]